MKLIYFTQNRKSVHSYINTVIQNEYSTNKIIDTDPRVDRHLTIIIEVEKDEYLYWDALQAITFSLKTDRMATIQVVETQYTFLLSMSLEDFLHIREYPTPNLFVDKLKSELDYFTELSQPGVNKFLGKDRIEYPLNYHPNYDFFILDDMRYFTNDYMKLLSMVDISREELNKLFRMTIWLNMPLYASNDLSKDFPIVSANNYCTYGARLRFEERKDIERPISLRLSELSNSGNVNTNAVIMWVNSNRILSFLKKFLLFKHKPENIRRLMPLSTYNDTIITLTLEQLSDFVVNPHKYEDKTYYQHINSVIFTLLNSDRNMEYILTGRE